MPYFTPLVTSFTVAGSRAVVAAAVVLLGQSAAFAEDWRYSSGAGPGGISAARGPGGAEVEVTCTGSTDVAMSLYFTGLGAKTVSLALKLDDKTAEKLPLSCGIGVCDLKVAQGGAAGLLSRLLSAQKLVIESQLNPDVALREIDTIALGSSAKALSDMAQDCGISPA